MAPPSDFTPCTLSLHIWQEQGTFSDGKAFSLQLTGNCILC